jgi:hypothetical protein
MGFLRQRYIAAYDNYRTLIGEYRGGNLGHHHDNLNTDYGDGQPGRRLALGRAVSDDDADH